MCKLGELLSPFNYIGLNEIDIKVLEIVKDIRGEKLGIVSEFKGNVQNQKIDDSIHKLNKYDYLKKSSLPNGSSNYFITETGKTLLIDFYKYKEFGTFKKLDAITRKYYLSIISWTAIVISGVSLIVSIVSLLVKNKIK